MAREIETLKMYGFCGRAEGTLSNRILYYGGKDPKKKLSLDKGEWQKFDEFLDYLDKLLASGYREELLNRSTELIMQRLKERLLIIVAAENNLSEEEKEVIGALAEIRAIKESLDSIKTIPAGSQRDNRVSIAILLELQQKLRGLDHILQKDINLARTFDSLEESLKKLVENLSKPKRKRWGLF